MFLLDHHRQPIFHHGVVLVLVLVLIASAHLLKSFVADCVCAQNCVLCSSQFVCVRACCVCVRSSSCVCVCVSVQYYRIVIVVRFPQLTRKLLLFGVAAVGPHAYEWIFDARRAWWNLSLFLSLGGDFLSLLSLLNFVFLSMRCCVSRVFHFR